MTKLCIATPLYPPEIGGPATFARIVESELRKRGIDITVVKWSDVKHIPNFIKHFFYFLHIWMAARKSNFVLALDPLGIGLPALLASRFRGLPFLVRIVGDRAWETYNQTTLEDFQKSKHGFKIEMYKKIQRFVVRRAKTVIVPSEFLKKIVMGWGVSEMKIKVIYNSFESPILGQTKEEARSQLKLEGKIIISAGRLVRWKGFAELIDAMQDISKSFPDAKLIIIGSGPEFKNYKLQITNYGLQKHITLTNALPQTLLHKYILAADLFVLNSGYEGLSHQLLEVMALGTPIVTTKIGGNPELIEDEANGLLVEYGDNKALKDAIIRILHDKNLASNLALKAGEQVKEFNKDKMIRSVCGLLDAIL